MIIGFPARPPQEPFDDSEWQTLAACANTDPEVFFPDKGHSNREAKQICYTCPVQAQCLQYALRNDMRWGIWGGLSDAERQLRKDTTPPRRPQTECGTLAGYRSHYRRGEQPCERCRIAGNASRRDTRRSRATS